MKKVLALLIVLSMFLYSEKVMLTKLGNGREAPSKNGQWHMYVCPGCVFDVVEEYGDYVFVEILTGTDHVGKKGYIWTKREKDGKVIKEGVCLRSTPKKYKGPKDKNVICTIPVGATVKKIKLERT